MAAVYGRLEPWRHQEVEREPEFHPQLARAIADICHRLAAPTAAADGDAEPAPAPAPAPAELERYVVELRALLDAFAPSVQVVMTCANILFAALPLAAVPLHAQLRWLHVLAGADHLARVASFRDAEARINSVRGFLEGLPPAPAGYVQPEQPPSRALACALVPQWACRLSPSSRHLGAQLAIVVRNLCTVVAECALGEEEEAAAAGEGGERGSAPLCALAATNAMVAIVKHWTGGLRQPAGANGGGADADADWAAAAARSAWQGELLLSGTHVLLELLPPRAPPRARAVGGLCHAAAVGLGLLLASSQATLHQLEAMRVARAHGGRPRDQFAPEGLEGSGAAFSQRILRAAVDCCTPGRPSSLTDAGLVLLASLGAQDASVWRALLAIVPADALRLAELLAALRWPARRATTGRPGPQPRSSFECVGEALLFCFLEHVCALHRRACTDGDASPAQLLLLPLLTATELTQAGFDCAAVFYATVHRLPREQAD